MEFRINALPTGSIHLARHAVRPMRSLAPGARLVCEAGVLWVTQSGDRDDHILTSGQELVVSQRGKVLVEALREADLRLA